MTHDLGTPPLELTRITVTNAGNADIGCPIADCPEQIPVSTSRSKLINADDFKDNRVYYLDLLDLACHLENRHDIPHEISETWVHSWTCDIDRFLQQHEAEQECADIRDSLGDCMRAITDKLADVERLMRVFQQFQNEWWEVSSCDRDDLRAHLGDLHRRVRDIDRIRPRLMPDWQLAAMDEKCSS